MLSTEPLTEDLVSQDIPSKNPLDQEFYDIALHTKPSDLEEIKETIPVSSTDTPDPALLMDQLLEKEYGFELLLDCIKENTLVAKDMVQFLKKRSQMEEDYARNMMKLVQSLVKNEQESSSTLSTSWDKFLKLHEKMGEARFHYSHKISGIAEEVNTLVKNTERSRKQLKEAGLKNIKLVSDADAALEKARSKYDVSSEEWERQVMLKEFGTGKCIKYGPRLDGGLRKSVSGTLSLWKQNATNKPLNMQKIQKQEEEARLKTAQANDYYKQQLQRTNQVRSDYFAIQLPQSLGETNDEMNQGLRYQLLRYSQELESAMMKEATTISPLPDAPDAAPGIQAVLEDIQVQQDFVHFAQHYSPKSKTMIQKSLYLPYSMYHSPEAQVKVLFGVDLTRHMERDGIEVPIVVDKCIQAIESPRFGALKVPGLYRVAGNANQVQLLRTMMDKDASSLNLLTVAHDVHDITQLLKLYFRELPDPLVCRQVYSKMMDAAKIENDQVRLVKIHELVNELPDAHYATLRAMMKHFTNICRFSQDNKMNAYNLSIIWSSTFMDATATHHDLRYQAKVIEVILSNYEMIFE